MAGTGGQGVEGRELPARLQAKDTWGYVDTRTRGPGCMPSRRRQHWAGWKHLRVCGAFAPSTLTGLEHSLLKRGSGLGGVKRRGTAGSLVSEPFVCAQGFANQWSSETMAPKGVTDVATLQLSFISAWDLGDWKVGTWCGGGCGRGGRRHPPPPMYGCT